MLWLSRWHHARRKQGGHGVATNQLIMLALVGLFVSSGLLMGAYGWKNFLSPWLVERNKKPSTEYLSQVQVGFSNRPDDPIIVVGRLAVTEPRIRVFVDHSGAMPPTRTVPTWWDRVQVGEIKDAVAGQPVDLAIVHRSSNALGDSKFLWANTNREVPSSHPDLVNVVYARIVLIGENGSEQHYYFRFMEPKQSRNQPFLILPAQEPQWVSAWEGKTN